MRLVPLLVVLVAILAMSDAWLFKEAEYATLFKNFMTKFAKSFSASAIGQKLIAFKNNVDKLTNLNKAAGGKAEFAVNAFSDLTPAEFKKLYTGAKAPAGASFLESLESMEAETYAHITEEALLESFEKGFDWGSKLMAPRNQKQCGSCWAFAAAGTIEAAYTISTGKKTSISPQAFVDCTPGDCFGCNGGYATCAFDHATKTGFFADSAAPYKGKVQKCNSGLKPIGKIASYKKVEKTINAFTGAVSGNGPVWITVNSDYLMQYKRGVIGKEVNCPTKFDHAVQLVGYGKDKASGKNFYKIRNSWGTDWGEGGYFRLEADGNVCGVHTGFGFYPKLK